MTLEAALARSAEELQRRLEEHRRLLTAAMEGDEEDLKAELCLLLDCPHKRRLRQVLGETIEVLEETRKSFKSRRVELLRKKLVRVLAEDA